MRDLRGRLMRPRRSIFLNYVPIACPYKPNTRNAQNPSLSTSPPFQSAPLWRGDVVERSSARIVTLDHISDETIQSETKDFVSQIAVPAETFARMVAFAINEPANVDVNEILFRPTAQPI
uniref:Short-chain dehydrogenase/reductase SDR n=1 Tax=Rubinisphaera brasiliensis (strain ATCC 49424 / DSM 5305 / JCM 21570 / IAM 15109 / NBRC 103401 / IFAM 1448) TaxID=756272 RepID=F0SSV7_RUBBR|nr:hypothetical protein Plabr_3852 [Rubinisphaera brasiliensis DSM 5305]